MFEISVVLFVVLVADRSAKINLAQSLNTSWSAVTPLGGEL